MKTRRSVIAGNDAVRKAVEKERAASAGLDPDFEEEHLLERDGDLPLRFWGDKIGSGRRETSDERHGKRGTQVNIYVTSSGKLVTEVHQWKLHPDLTRYRHACQAHSAPAQALAWLKADAKGVLGSASKKAWLQACETYGPLASFAAEDID
jgi:hypothetical protein